MMAKVNHVRSLLQQEFTQTPIMLEGNDLFLPLKKRLTITFTISDNEILIAPSHHLLGWSRENGQLLQLTKDRIKRVFSLAKMDCVFVHFIGS